MISFTQEFTRNDGEQDKAVIMSHARKMGFSASIRIGGRSRIVTATMMTPEDAVACALRMLTNHRENAIL